MPALYQIPSHFKKTSIYLVNDHQICSSGCQSPEATDLARLGEGSDSFTPQGAPLSAACAALVRRPVGMYPLQLLKPEGPFVFIRLPLELAQPLGAPKIAFSRDTGIFPHYH